MTELVFILDRSGYISGLERDTIGGFNSMLEKLQEFLTLRTWNDRMEIGGEGGTFASYKRGISK